MKRNFIKLVKNVEAVETKNAEPLFDTYVTPAFIPMRKVYDAMDTLAKIDEEETSEKEAIDIMIDTVCDIYNNQFTHDEVLDRLHSPDAFTSLQEQVQFAAQGTMDDERKKELKALLK